MIAIDDEAVKSLGEKISIASLRRAQVFTSDATPEKQIRCSTDHPCPSVFISGSPQKKRRRDAVSAHHLRVVDPAAFQESLHLEDRLQMLIHQG